MYFFFFLFSFFLSWLPFRADGNRREVNAATLKGKPNTSDAECFRWDLRGGCEISRRLAELLMQPLFVAFIFFPDPQTLSSWEHDNKNLCVLDS